MISVVYKDQIDNVWETLRPQIIKALKCGTGDGETEEHLYNEVVADRMFMLVKHEGEKIIAGGIFSIQNHPCKTTLFIEILAGKNLKSWINEVEETLKRIKDEKGYDTIEASCRPGLTRMLKHWKPKATIMELI